MKMRDWKKKWNHSMMHYDVENGEASSLPSGAGVQGPSAASEGGGGAVAGGAAAGDVPPSAHPQAKQPLSSSVPAETTGVLGLLHSFLIPDRGGYAARGPRIDDQGGVTGSLGRDYAPRRQEADAVEESDDEGDESDPESDERAHGHRHNPAGPRGSDRDAKQKRAKTKSPVVKEHDESEAAILEEFANSPRTAHLLSIINSRDVSQMPPILQYRGW